MKYPRDHYSYSSFSKFEQCPRCWWYYYVKYAGAKQEESFALILGDAYHQALEAMYRGKPKEECLEIFDKLTRGKAFTSLVAKDTATMRQAVEYYYSAIYPLYRNRVDVIEMDAKIKFPEVEIPFQFRIDLATKDGVIIDHKTAGRTEPEVEKNTQLSLYSYAYMLDTGRLPRQFELHIASKSPKGARVEIKTYSPKLPEVLKVVSRFRSFVKRVEMDDFPAICGKYCDYYSWKDECDKLIVETGGDPTVVK